MVKLRDVTTMRQTLDFWYSMCERKASNHCLTIRLRPFSRAFFDWEQQFSLAGWVLFCAEVRLVASNYCCNFVLTWTSYKPSYRGAVAEASCTDWGILLFSVVPVGFHEVGGLEVVHLHQPAVTCCNLLELGSCNSLVTPFESIKPPCFRGVSSFHLDSQPA